MVNYIYKGYGVTDSNGIAHLDHDASGNPINHSYTGVGAGEIDVVASLDNPIASGSIVSEPYEVLDCIVFDDMETDHLSIYNYSNTANLLYSTEWALGGNSLKWDYDNTGTTTTKYWGWQFIQNPSSTAYDISALNGKTVKLEMDINSEIDFSTSANAGFYIRVYYKDSSHTSWTALTNSNLIYSNVTHYQDSFEVPNDCTGIWIRINANGNCPSGVMYTDNWKIYPI